MKKKILLLGDSIRKGYDSYVKESMASVADVFYPAENCQFTAYMLRNVHIWKTELGLDTADAVHFNAGLWDTLRIYGDAPLTQPDAYADNLCRLADRLSFLFPGAKLIFATSTPVVEEGYIRDFEFRSNADVERYNAIARDVLVPRGVIVNDLYALLKDKPELHSDQSHYYTAAGTELIGKRVAGVLCGALGLDVSRCVFPDPRAFEITCYKNDSQLYVKKGNCYEPVKGI